MFNRHFSSKPYPINVPAAHSGTFLPGMLVGANHAGEISAWEPLLFNDPIGIVEDHKGTSGTSCRGNMATVWDCTVRFETSMYVHGCQYNIGTNLSWDFIMYRWCESGPSQRVLGHVVSPPVGSLMVIEYNHSNHSTQPPITMEKVSEVIEEGCFCASCGDWYQYVERKVGFVCRKCKSYRYMVMGNENG